MHTLILGPSGSGKTYVAHALQQAGINAFDVDELAGLSAWYNREGRKVPAPQTAAEALQHNYAFLWSRKALQKFLNQHSQVYLFGGSGNVFNLLDLFDRVYFLQVSPALQRERLRSPARPTPAMDMNQDEVVIWGQWFEEQARKQGIFFIDASQTPEQIFAIISR